MAERNQGATITARITVAYPAPADGVLDLPSMAELQHRILVAVAGGMESIGGYPEVRVDQLTILTINKNEGTTFRSIDRTCPRCGHLHEGAAECEVSLGGGGRICRCPNSELPA
jgi:hypothetical protein